MEKLSILIAVVLVTAAMPAVAAAPAELSTEPALGWDRTFEVEDWNLTQPRSLLVLPNGDFAEAGRVASSEGGLSPETGNYLRVFDADGTQRWSRLRVGGSDPVDLSLAGDDTIVATWPSEDGTRLSVEALAPNGAPRWSAPEGAVITDDAAVAAGTSRIGVVGKTDGSLAGTNQGRADAYLRSYTADGTHEWDRQFGTTVNDAATDVVMLDDGTLVVGGTTSGTLAGSSAGAADAFLRAYSPTGTVLWTRQFGTAANDALFALAVSPDGTIVAFGTNPGDPDAWFFRGLDGDGSLIWSTSIAVTYDVHATDAIVADDGTLLVAGFTGGDSTYYYQRAVGFVRAFDTAGSLLWSDERADTNPFAVAQTSDQSILLAGETLNLGFSRALAPEPTELPAAPTDLSTRPKIGALDVSWTGPTGAVTSYTATATPGDGTCTTSSTSCTIPDLDPAADYTVSVVATNSVGSTSSADPASGTPLIDCDEGAASPFTDVSATSFAINDVACLWRLELTTGTSATIYSPAASGTREQMAAFLARLNRTLTGDSCEGTHPFADVSATSFAFDDIGCIYALGVTTGTSATIYSPAASVTREQMASFLARSYRTLGYACPTGDHPFTDVSATSFAFDDIGCIYALGVTTGTSPTTYSPNDPVTREQMASFLARLVRVSLAT